MDTVFYRLKVAAAIAVLRQKPTEADAYQYTRQLCAKYSQAQTQWRARYFQAQDALLHLKQQQLVMCMTHPEGSAYPPTPPSSGPEGSSTSGQSAALTVTRQQALVSSGQFIHAVVSLVTAARTESSDPSHTDSEARCLSPSEVLSGVSSLLSHTVPACVRHLREVVSSGAAHVSTHCVMQGLGGLALLLDADWLDTASAGCYLRLLLEQLGSLTDDLLERLFLPRDGQVLQVSGIVSSKVE
ncbi:hypothetical protein ACOMHN_007964 [Nucella lapillus]